MHLRGQGASWTDYIFFGGQRIAVNTGADLSTAKFLHADHLGSTRVCTDANGNATGQCAYEPFGEFTGGASACTIPIQYRFAGMEYDSETGLYHTWFRQYDPSQGRWTGVDPLAVSLHAPQSLTRYAYVLNAPVNFVDPLGLFVFVDPEDGCTYWLDDVTEEVLGVFCPRSGRGVGGGGLSCNPNPTLVDNGLPPCSDAQGDGAAGGSPQQAPAQDTELQKQQECAEVLVDALLKRDKLAPFVVGTPEVKAVRTSKNDFTAYISLEFLEPIPTLLPSLGTFAKFGSGYRSIAGVGQPGLEIVPDPLDPKRTTGITVGKQFRSDIDFVTPAGPLWSLPFSLLGHFFRDVLRLGAVTPCNALKNLRL